MADVCKRGDERGLGTARERERGEEERALQVGAGTGPGEGSAERRGSMASSHGRSDLRFADWMASLPANMHRIPLTNLAIPGKRFSAFQSRTGCASLISGARVKPPSSGKTHVHILVSKLLCKL